MTGIRAGAGPLPTLTGFVGRGRCRTVRLCAAGPAARPSGCVWWGRSVVSCLPALAGVRHAEYDPANTRTSWEDGRWGG